ncbi:protein SCAI-like isoform X4 [Pecten maximus]|uniref:protein SCAI-like isoform X4 n=1 Tax=Pecten maximus TaxID=6579 RepID=UPI0014587E73|nr:protein SCAI-like isoform X4 [Pecten maximus]
MSIADGSLPAMDETEKKVVNEFCHLLEKSKQLFNGLRDLPQYGHKQWQSYFGRTFDVYTKLWKFQQQHRQILDTKYGLKRWQIGEVASKIGQLYYHYYLRTSETNYLNESFSFYSAIRMRVYYSKANKEERPDLMVKKLRYYARFIVVCLLLKKMKLVRDLVRELSKQIDDYTSTYEPEDKSEWRQVLDEIKAFIEADNIISVVDIDSSSIVLSHRLTPMNNTPLDPKGTPVYLSLQEILIVGNSSEQVKFSELTLDMFRMLQTLEREPQEDLSNQIFDASPAPGKPPFENGDRNNRRENPHKYLLYKPTFSQLNTFLASGFKELPPNGAMLLYISADGCLGNAKRNDDAAYDLGGVVTNSRKDGDIMNRNKRSGTLKEMHCLHPGDVYPYCRKPMFLIIDSDNSSAFQNFPNLFGQPVVCLLSQEQVPTTMQDHQKGNLFTLFLHSPLMAFCYVCNINDIPITKWEKCQGQIDKFMSEASKLFLRSRSLDHSYLQFIGDDFLRLLMFRFVFCYIVLILHRGFKGPSYFPMSHPPLPTEEILEHPNLYKVVLDLSTLLNSRMQFAEPGEGDIHAT